jgi:hypothetical protein
VPGSSSFSSTARRQANEILSKAPYRKSPGHTPRPLAGLFHALGRALHAVIGRPAEWLYHHPLLHIGHGFTTAFGGWWELVLGAMAVALGVVVGVLIARRRTRVSARLMASGAGPISVEDPDDIERRAAEAERGGDYEAAVRLRFRAGLLRLGRQGIVFNQDALTGRQLSSVLHSPTFDTLARRHERIVYAGDRATAVDSTAARQSWPQVLVESRSGPDAGDGGGSAAPSSWP